MSQFLTNLSPFFDAGVRERGHHYALEHRVRVESYDAKHIKGTVAGTERYTVSIQKDGTHLICGCTCPHLAKGDLCKHIWAALCWADERAVSFTGERGLVAIPDYDMIDDGMDEDSPEFGELPFEDHDEDTPVKILPFKQQPHKPSPPIAYGSSFLQPATHAPRRPAAAGPAAWEGMFPEKEVTGAIPVTGPQARLLYSIEPGQTRQAGTLTILVQLHRQLKNGEWSAPSSPSRYTYGPQPSLSDEDQQILSLLNGSQTLMYGYLANDNVRLDHRQASVILPLMAATGRFYFSAGAPAALSFSPDSYTPDLELVKDGSRFALRLQFVKGEERIDLRTIDLITAGGFFFERGRFARFDDCGAFASIEYLRTHPELRIPGDGVDPFLIAHARSAPRLPLRCPPELTFTEEHPEPVPLLRVLGKDPFRRSYMLAEVRFKYGNELVHPRDPRIIIADPKRRVIMHIDRGFHHESLETLREHGFTSPPLYQAGPGQMRFRESAFAKVVAALLEKGWVVEDKGGLFRKPGRFTFGVTSGIDWFDLDASCDYGDVRADLPEILAALRAKEQFVRLDDGTLGLLPEEWLAKYARVIQMGTVHEDVVRFQSSQALFLDMLLAEQEDADCDRAYRVLRDSLRGFTRPVARNAPRGFRGTLREYQREGLGWLHFLRKLNFGGCLADDMGLGKTIQVLALLAGEHTGDAAKSPSLIVVPRSLIFNWIDEASRFTPGLRVVDFSGTGRSLLKSEFKKCDVALMTYGTVMRDIEALRKLQFHYCILDEAQAVKSAATYTAKAVRLLPAAHRLALSGTPVQNHLDDLWSIFEFLNPGMLGTARVFSAAKGNLQADDPILGTLRQALRPFILRRTKEQVAPDLPVKTEEVIHCEMGLVQRRIYSELRDHYRSVLLPQVDRDGINNSKIQILEALLRLRQAACHPGLIDRELVGGESAKLETLLAQVDAIREEGHKCLIFSQFTTMLSIICKRLTAAGHTFEYLDGKTRDRKERVARFQSDPDCGIFCISLKAGGVGLNLTAAEYVFIFDPWWNPAVEAQAVDRTHRIGQERPVFSYRLICKNTVEEKVLQMQATKRALAESIISADASLLRSITMNDLKVLLE